MTVRAKYNFVEWLKDDLEKQKTSVEKAQTVLDTSLVETGARQIAAPTVMTGHRIAWLMR